LPSVQHTTEEDNPTDKHLHLSTADPLAGGFYPWLSFESARWLTFKPAPTTMEAVEFATLEWVSWFNNTRLLAPIGYIPPAEAEANYYWELARPLAEAA